VEVEEWVGPDGYKGCEHYVLSMLLWLCLFQGFVGGSVALVVISDR